MNSSARNKPHFNITLLGHVDVGKTALMNRIQYVHILYDNMCIIYNNCTFIRDKPVEALDIGYHRWFLKNIETESYNFQTNNRRFTIFDTNGFKNGLSKVIKYAFQ